MSKRKRDEAVADLLACTNAEEVETSVSMHWPCMPGVNPFRPGPLAQAFEVACVRQAEADYRDEARIARCEAATGVK